MYLVLQPPESKICGPCCIATITGVDLEYILQLIGHQKGTNGAELRKALRLVDYTAGPAIRVTPKTKLPKVAILSLRPTPEFKRPGFYGHWVVHFEGKVLCPSQGPFDSIESYFDLMGHLRLASYMKVEPTQKK